MTQKQVFCHHVYTWAGHRIRIASTISECFFFFQNIYWTWENALVDISDQSFFSVNVTIET